jgi:xylulokinase
MPYVLGLDISTTATKAVLIDGDGRVAGIGTDEYDVRTPRPRWSEQDPGSWWSAAVAAIRRALVDAAIDGTQVDAVGLSGQMHGLVLLDADDAVLRPAILWNDQRTIEEVERLRQLVGRRRLIEVTGNDAMTGFTASKLLWVQSHEPEIWRRIAHVLLPKDEVRRHLTGAYATDKADGAGTQLFDLAARDWSQEVLDAVGLDPAWLPRSYEGPEVTGLLTRSAADATGLSAGTPVVAGGGDQAATAVGLGATEPGVVTLSLGTSGVIFAPTSRPVTEPDGRVHAFCHAVPERWHLMGVMLSAAGSLRWFRDALMPDATFEDVTASASDIAAGAEGLSFLPYLTGERTPHADPDARGAFVGLTVTHDRRHLARAVMEGVAFGLRDGLELMVEAGLARPTRLRVSGGGTRSPLWRSILADVLEADLEAATTVEGAAFGAGLLAAVGAGWFPDVDAACSATVALRPVGEPGPAVDHYREVYEGYRALYPALAPIFHEHRSGR